MSHVFFVIRLGGLDWTVATTGIELGDVSIYCDGRRAAKSTWDGTRFGGMPALLPDHDASERVWEALRIGLRIETDMASRGEN